MDKISTLISLNEAKKTIDDLILKVRHENDEEETDTRKLIIIILSVIGALVVIGVIAFAVYKHISNDGLDDYDDLFEDDPDDLISEEEIDE